MTDGIPLKELSTPEVEDLEFLADAQGWQEVQVMCRDECQVRYAKQS